MCITSVKMSANCIEFLLSGSIFGHFQCTANLFYLKGLTILDYNKRIFKGHLHSQFNAKRVTKFEVTTSSHVFRVKRWHQNLHTNRT